ncbi:hypothetical protein NMY22_g12536 [Coprinellus aureogranulatus]|nr:hypothetical protein NMY22_g12536 [Coprinellus aureogranulatus]
MIAPSHTLAFICRPCRRTWLPSKFKADDASERLHEDQRLTTETKDGMKVDSAAKKKSDFANMRESTTNITFAGMRAAQEEA